ncbi:MAG TPA: hypothetical protein VLM37_10095 [Fibrobacteraceae bacterium]|nr:hypothetical protein [Fibrobacteraceae bacterium]
MNRKILALTSLLSASLLVGCLSDSDDDDDGNSSAVSSSVALSAGSSAAEISATSSAEEDSSAGSSATEASAGSSLVLEFTSDYASGALRWLDGDSLSSSLLEFYEDARISVQGQYLYVLERSGTDNLSKLDLSELSTSPTSAVLYQNALASGANPEDVAILNDTIGWLAQSGNNNLLAFNPKDGSIRDTVDLSAYAQDGESSPNPYNLALSGDTLYVIMQRLILWSPDKPALVARFNAQTGTLIDTLQLIGHNPNAALIYQGKLYVANSGDLMSSDLDSTKSIDVLDLATGTVSQLLNATTLGGGPLYLALDSANGLFYTTVYKSYGAEPVAAVNISDGSISLDSIPGVVDAFGGLAFDASAGILYIGERETDLSGLKAWDGSALKTISSGDALPPYGIVVANW